MCSKGISVFPWVPQSCRYSKQCPKKQPQKMVTLLKQTNKTHTYTHGKDQHMVSHLVKEAGFFRGQ